MNWQSLYLNQESDLWANLDCKLLEKWIYISIIFVFPMTFPGSSDGKTSAYNAGGPGLIPGSGRSPGDGNGSPLQYSCLENPMDGGSWGLQSKGLQRVGHDWATLHSLSWYLWAFQVVLVVKNPPANAGDTRDMGSIPGYIPWRRAWQPTPVFLPGESHGQRSLVGYSP